MTTQALETEGADIVYDVADPLLIADRRRRLPHVGVVLP
jgi:hypothetical protein